MERLAEIKLWVHEDVVNQDYVEAETLLRALLHSVRAGLLETSGSRLRRLRGPWGGRAFRARWGHLRLPFSWVTDANGVEHICVHLVGPRNDIYAGQDFVTRLERFHRELWPNGRSQWLIRPDAAGYLDASALVGAREEEDPGQNGLELEPVLSDGQRAALRCMLPFPASFGSSDASVILAHGPPGSGKTVLAAEAAREAVEAHGQAVLVIVPSKRLFQVYLAELVRLGVKPLTWEEFEGRPENGVCVVEMSSLVQAMRGSNTTEREREINVDSWWRACLSAPALRQLTQQHGAILTRRFGKLIDALLADSTLEDLVANPKDALDTQDETLYKLIATLRARRQWMGVQAGRRREAAALLRCEVAEEAKAKVLERGWGNGPMLIIADEAQDLIPSEWRLLVDWCAARHGRTTDGAKAAGAPTRLVLLGDENQRVNPTSFSWAEVKRYVGKRFNDPERGVSEARLNGSFRLPARIAAVANALFDDKVADLGRARDVKRAELSLLSPGGEVHVRVIEQAAAILEDILLGLPRQESEDRRLRVIAPGWISIPPEVVSRANVDLLEPRVAKGLEFRSVVLALPFQGASSRIDFATLTEAYTSLTRAFERVMVLLTRAEWSLVRQQWLPLVSDAVELEAGHEVAMLQEELLRYIDMVSAEDRGQLYVRQLRDLLDRSSASEPPAVAERLVDDIVALCHKIFEAGLLGEAGEFAGALERLGSAADLRLDQLTSEALERGEHLRASAALLLRGEIAGAITEATHHSVPSGAAARGGWQIPDLHHKALVLRKEERFRSDVAAESIVDLALLRSVRDLIVATDPLPSAV